jgi:hypothetical protein
MSTIKTFKLNKKYSLENPTDMLSYEDFILRQKLNDMLLKIEDANKIEDEFDKKDILSDLAVQTLELLKALHYQYAKPSLEQLATLTNQIMQNCNIEKQRVEKLLIEIMANKVNPVFIDSHNYEFLVELNFILMFPKNQFKINN